MQCERCGETLVHEDEQVDDMCRKCMKKVQTNAAANCQKRKRATMGFNPMTPR